MSTFIVLTNPHNRSLVWRAALGGLCIVIKRSAAHFSGDIFEAAKKAVVS